jgi:hypothetical protein
LPFIVVAVNHAKFGGQLETLKKWLAKLSRKNQDADVSSICL